MAVIYEGKSFMEQAAGIMLLGRNETDAISVFAAARLFLPFRLFL